MATTIANWCCRYCGTEDIPGYQYECPGCSHPRHKGVVFYLPPNAPEVTPEMQKLIGSGNPNWYCEHCGCGNRDTATTCADCGAPKGTSPSHKIRYYKEGEKYPETPEEAKALEKLRMEEEERQKTQREKPVGTSFSSASTPSSAHKETQAVRHTFPPMKTKTYPTKSHNESWLEKNGNTFKKALPILGIVFAALFVGFLVYQFFFNTHIDTVTVEGYHWDQNVYVEEFQVVHDSSWSSHPADAYNIVSDYRDTGRDEKIHDGWKTEYYTDTCYDTKYVSKTCTGQKDNGDGTYSSYTYECGSNVTTSYSCQKSRQVELYHYEDIEDWYYEYDINRWVGIENYPTSGNDQDPYYYEDFVLVNPYDGFSEPVLGQQRKFEQPGTYTVYFYCEDNTKVGDDGYFNRNYSLEEWEFFTYEYHYSIEVNAFNSIISKPDAFEFVD